MKKIIILITALTINFVTTAQTDSTSKKDEKVEINIGNKKIIIKTSEKGEVVDVDLQDKNNETSDKKSCKPTYPNVEVTPSFDFGVAGLLYQKNGFTGSSPLSTASSDMNYKKNRHYGINMHLSFNLTKNFGILTGIGYNMNRYTFKENLTVDPEDGNFMTDSVNDYNYFQFNNYYWQIPLMLKFQSNSGDFQFAAGGILGYNSTSKVKYEYVEGNTEYETTIRGNFNVNPLKLSLGARINYNEIGIFFNYALSTLNSNSYTSSTENYDLMPFSAGITIGGF